LLAAIDNFIAIAGGYFYKIFSGFFQEKFCPCAGGKNAVKSFSAG